MTAGEWYPCYVVFRMDRAGYGKRPTEHHFKVSNATWHELLDEFMDCDYADKMED